MLAFCPRTEEQCIGCDAREGGRVCEDCYTEGSEEGVVQAVEDGVLGVDGEGEGEVIVWSCFEKIGILLAGLYFRDGMGCF